MPNRQEIATIEVNGRRFEDWETVWVQHRWTEAYPLFRFTCAERGPPSEWQLLQFKPGDECAIYLGGLLAITGVILVRQVAYDANSHAVMLQGVGIQWYVGRASVLDKKGNFDKMTFEQVARKVIAPFGIEVKTVGTLNATPYEKLQVEPGETVWAFLERIARPRGIILGTDHEGAILLIDNHTAPVTAQLLEGENILKCQCLISMENMFSEYWVRAQKAASDPSHGTRRQRTGGGRSRQRQALQPVADTGRTAGRHQGRGSAARSE